MELLYIWIESYKNIKQQGFNFSPQYRFEFVYDEKTSSGELTVTENPNHIPNFFPEGISNVTAIIGENGAGKSSLLEFIWESNKGYFYTKNSESISTCKSIMIYSKNIYYHKDIKLNNRNTLNNWNIKEFTKKEDITEKKELPFIHYSNVFNPIGMGLDPFGLDISNIEKLLYSTQGIEEFTRDKLGYFSIYSSYYANNIKSQANFLIDLEKIDGKNKKALPFTIPTHINISLDYTITNNMRDIPKYKKKYPNISFIEATYEQIALYLLNVCFYSNSELDKEKYIAKFNHIFTEFPDKENILLYIDYLEKDTSLQGVTRVVSLKTVKKYVQEILSTDFIDMLNNGDIIEKDKRYISVKLSKNNSDFILKLFDTGFREKMFYYSWSNVEFSSGEDNFLNICARFYQVLFKSFNEKDIAHTLNLLILIDEGENTLHPQWQKQYIKMLIDLFCVIFGEVKIDDFHSVSKKVQIILTSHSPFLASDLPNENIIFLEKGAEGNCIVKNSLNDMKHTFGANIHTLLTDSFFMKDGLMGDFAKAKINEVIKFLNGEKSEIENNEIAQKYIRAIGEPIIRNQLQKILDSKRLSKVEAIEETIKKHEEIIKGLQNQLKENNNL